MGTTAGFNSSIVLAPTANPVSMTDASMSDSGNGTTWYIDASGKTFLNPGAQFTVKVNGSSVSNASFSIRYLMGIVEFNTSQAGNTVTISGEYYPQYTFPDAYTVSYDRSYGDLDYTVFSESGRTRKQGLQDVSAEVGFYNTKDNPLDGGGGSEPSLTDLLVNEDEPFGFEIVPEGQSLSTPQVYRSWMKIPEYEISSSPDGKTEGTVSLVAAHQAKNLQMTGTQSVNRLFDSTSEPI